MFSTILQLDVYISSFIHSQLHGSILDPFMVFITKLGDAGALWIILCIVLICFKKTRRAGVAALAALAVSFVLSQCVLKPLFMRARPFEVIEGIKLLILPPRGSSFPSSHTVTSFATAVTLFLVNKRFGTCAVLVASLIALSRIYLCVHFSSDVIFGAVLGVIIGFFAYKIGGKNK